MTASKATICSVQMAAFFQSHFMQTSAGAVLLTWAIFALYRTCFKPLKLRRHYEKQGIKGPPFRLLVGNLPEIRSLTLGVGKYACGFEQPSKLCVAPELCKFVELYGNVSVHELGAMTRLVIANPKLAKEVLVTKASYYQKSSISREVLASLVGNGLALSEGEFWKQQRRILSPAFRMEYLKKLFKHVCSGGQEVANRWSKKIKDSGSSVEIEIFKEMSIMAMDIITRASFGATMDGSTKAANAFQLLVDILNSRLSSVYSYKRLIPEYRNLPTIENLRLWKKEKYLDQQLEEIMETRLAKSGELEGETDIFGVMIKGKPKMSINQMMDESKNIFLAGHATTALLLTWALAMLSKHTFWQQEARKEVFAILGGSHLTFEHLGKLEILSMIINETLRLFPPVGSVSRKCSEAHQIGNISVVPGTNVLIPIILLHQMEEIWGVDVYEFNPERFRRRNKIKGLEGFMPFGGGPRICVGSNFAIMEAKTLLVILLQNFEFSLSPLYEHGPGCPLNMKPTFGCPIMVQKI